MKINVITLMPEMVESGLSYGVVGAAFKKGLCLLETINPRLFTDDNHQSVDDRPFGGGDGMLMMAEPLQRTLNALNPPGPVYFLSPQGQTFDDALATELAKVSEVTFISGRYGGIDQRFLQHNHIQELSLGDFVLSGGEPAVIAIVDSVVRKLPGVLGHVASAQEDSFAKQGLLEMPHFTRPQNWQGLSVPPILLSGNHQKIEEYKTSMSLVTTLVKRPDLLNKIKVSWSDLYQYLEQMADEDWQPLGFDKNEVKLRVKERLSLQRTGCE